MGVHFVSRLLGWSLLPMLAGCVTPGTPVSAVGPWPYEPHEPRAFLRSRSPTNLPPIARPSPRRAVVVPTIPTRPAVSKPGLTVQSAPVRMTNDFRGVLAVQVFLDRNNLSCGCIDGVMGAKTRSVLKAWQAGHNAPASGEIDAAVLAAAGSLDAALTTHVVSQAEEAALMSVPDTWEGKAAVDRLGYQTILETVAEKYHSTEGLLRRLNPDTPWPNPPAGTALIVPNPFPSSQSRAVRLVIQIPRKAIQAYDAENRLLAQFPCSIAARAEKRPTGELKVINCAPNPDYLFDPKLFAEDPEASRIGRRLIIPPGPNNPVGVAWIGLSLPGYGMHGTPKPEDIGKTESHGCFRLANWNAEKLLRMIVIGMPVTMDWRE